MCATAYVSVWGFNMPAHLLPRFWTAILGGAIANFFIQFLNAKAASIDQGEVSLTAPLQSMTPGLIIGLAILLNEYPGKVGVMGVFAMATASYIILCVKDKTTGKYNYTGPLKRLTLLLKLGKLSKEERGQTLVVAMAFVSALMDTVGLLFDGLYTRRGGDMQGLMMAIIALIGSLGLSYTIWYFVKPDSSPAQKTNFFSVISGKKMIGLIVLFAVVWSLHWILIQPTFNKAFVAYVGTLKRFHIIIGVVLGHILFKEGDFKKRLGAALLIILGAVLISMDGLPARVSAKIEGLGF